MMRRTIELLTSEEAGEVLAAALATVGGHLTQWSIDAVHARPGAETSVGYAVETDSGASYMVASDVSLAEAERSRAGAVRLEADDHVLHVWQHPADPRLPGLSIACTLDSLARRWQDTQGEAVSITALDVAVLRPLRRAVVRATLETDPTRPWFIKVVRPATSASLLERHRLCALAPRALDLGDGIVAVESAAGVPLTHALYRPHGGAPASIEPAMLLEALKSLPDDAQAFKPRIAVADRLDAYVALAVDQGLPTTQVHEIVRAITPGLERGGTADAVTHGDFHAANVWVDSAADPSHVSTLIDIDTLGPGRRVDDLACMLAHLLVLPTLDAAGYPNAQCTAGTLFDAFARECASEELRARTAANLVALAAGADSRELGERWLDLAHEVAREQRLA